MYEHHTSSSFEHLYNIAWLLFKTSLEAHISVTYCSERFKSEDFHLGAAFNKYPRTNDYRLYRCIIPHAGRQVRPISLSPWKPTHSGGGPLKAASAWPKPLKLNGKALKV